MFLKLFVCTMAMMAAAVRAIKPVVECSAVIKHRGKKFKYDLTPLYHPPSEPDNLYIYKEATGAIFSANICGLSSLGCEPMDSSTVCGYTRTTNAASYGNVNTQKFSEYNDMEPGQGVTVTYTGGATCPGKGSRSTHFLVKCLSAERGYVYDVSSDDENDCEINMYIYSKHGCGVAVSGGLGAGGIILIM